MLLSIAWKNVWRNKLRSLIVIIAISLGLVGGIFSAAVMKGAAKDGVRGMIDNYISEIQIHQPLFKLNNETKYHIKNSNEFEKNIKNIEGVKSVSSRLKVTGMASSANSAVGVSINGINPEQEKLVTTIYKNILDSSGTYFETKSRNPAIISKRLAEKLKLRLRSKIILTFPTSDGSQIETAFKIIGVFKTTNSTYDKLNIYVNKSDLARLTGYSEDVSQEIAIRINKEASIDSIKSKISKNDSTLLVETWKDLVPTLAMSSGIMDQMILVFLIIILMALGFGIVNTMLMVVLERIKEIGMLMAVGMSKIRIFFMIMFETIFLSLVGGVIGMSISAVLIGYYNINGITFSGLDEAFEKFGYPTTIYPELEPTVYFTLSFLIILTGIIASIYPARKALKLNPVEALRSDA